MAGPWLYAISERAGMYFELKSKKTPVSVESYEKLLKTGELTQDKWWYISQNWKNAQLNDEVFIYTGDEDRGIIGYGTILEVKWRGGCWCIRLSLDVVKSRALLRKPIPAKTVRRWVRFPRRNLTDLARYKAQLIRLLP